MPPPDISRDPYPSSARTLVVRSSNAVAARTAYDNNKTPRDFLVGQAASLDGKLPTGEDGFFLVRSPQAIPTNVDAALFAFMGFSVPDIVEAAHWMSSVESFMQGQDPMNPVVDSTYIQGMYGSPAPPLEPTRERDVGLQDYVQPARYGGIDAIHAWMKGVTGKQETLYVMESGVWREHIEFRPGSVGEVPPGLPSTALVSSRQHGTGVMGVILASRNTQNIRKGMLGIAFDAKARLTFSAPGSGLGSPNNQPITAMLAEISTQPGGTVVLFEFCHMPAGTNLWLPIETDPFAASAITSLMAMDAVVIQAAGNSDEDIDAHLPNPTGAIIVGASRYRSPFAKTLLSNYSATDGKVQLFSWGEGVYTTCLDVKPGSPDPPSPADFVSSYAYMSGTSAAAAIVAGAAVAVQCWKRSQSGGWKPSTFFNNAQMLAALSAASASSNVPGATPCQPGAGIGVQPNLKAIIP